MCERLAVGFKNCVLERIFYLFEVETLVYNVRHCAYAKVLRAILKDIRRYIHRTHLILSERIEYIRVILSGPFGVCYLSYGTEAVQVVGKAQNDKIAAFLIWCLG